MATETAGPRKCLGVDCGKDATALQCPKCQKLGKESYFCSQDCFKKSWVHTEKPHATPNSPADRQTTE